VIRRLIACIAIAVLASTCFGAAASLAVTADRVAAGSSNPSVTCATGTTVTYVYTGSNVSSVQVSNLPSACHDGKIWLALQDATGAKVSEAAPVIASGASATLNVEDVPASQVKKYTIAVVK
jgi:hypothetical protein